MMHCVFEGDGYECCSLQAIFADDLEGAVKLAEELRRERREEWAAYDGNLGEDSNYVTVREVKAGSLISAGLSSPREGEIVR